MRFDRVSTRQTLSEIDSLPQLLVHSNRYSTSASFISEIRGYASTVIDHAVASHAGLHLMSPSQHGLGTWNLRTLNLCYDDLLEASGVECQAR